MLRLCSWSNTILSRGQLHGLVRPPSRFAVASRAMASVKAPSAGMKAPFLNDPTKFVAGVDTFMFDMDGVIWKGGNLIGAVPETLALLRSLGKKLYFVTNNSTKSRKQLHQKFKKLGLDINEEEVLSSSFAAAGYLKSINFPSDKKVYVVGDIGIQQELDLAGIQHLGGPEDSKKMADIGDPENIEYDQNVGAVVVGFDMYINYYKLVYATLCLREIPGCHFIATNPDSVANLTDTQKWPAGGCMVGAIKASTEMEPVMVGKPSSFMMDYLANKFQISKSQICMVGDSLDTDILFGQGGGCKTLLVLSGVTDLKKLHSPDNVIRPDFYTNQLSDLLATKE